MRRTEIDGVPAFWMSGPPPLSAELIFGTGQRDEPFARAGITHLVEHLVMSALDRRHHFHNASVSIGSTSFTASGRPEDVRDFLHDVCAAIWRLPTGRLRTERRILAAEGPRVSMLGCHLLLRYGLRGAGLAGAAPPALDQIGADEVRDWAARELVRSNAVLALSGPPPDGLRLELPDGPRPDRPLIEPLPLRSAVWSWHPASRGLGLSLLVPHRPAASVAAAVLRRRLTDELRHRLGLVYDVDTAVVPVDAGRDQLFLQADPAARDAPVAAGIVNEVMRDLRRTGPSAAELAEVLAGAREEASDPRTAGPFAALAALEHLRFGRDWDVDGELAELAAVTASDVQMVLAAYATTAIATVPDGVDLRVAGFELRPASAGRWLDGRAFPRRPFGRAPRGARLVIGDEGVSVRLREDVVSVPWSDLVGYGIHADGRRTLYGIFGTRIELDPAHFLAGRRALARVDKRVRAEVRFTEPDREPAAG